MLRDESDILGFQFDVLSRAARHYQPWLRLSALGRERLTNGKPQRGRLVGVAETGSLRVRKAGQKSTGSYYPGFWEFDPNQSI